MKLNFNTVEQIVSAMQLPQSVHQEHFLIDDAMPKELLRLVPHASIFGIADDSARAALFKACSVNELVRLKEDVLQFDDVIDAWLAGPAADALDPSDAYVCFSALRMGIDAI